MLFPHLSAALDPLHEAEEYDDPGEQQRQREVPLEPAEVTGLAQTAGDVQHVLLPELGGGRLDAVKRDDVENG